MLKLAIGVTVRIESDRSVPGEEGGVDEGYGKFDLMAGLAGTV